MATILFADANESALRTMKRAQELGHRTFIIRGASWQVYHETDWIRATLEATDGNVSIPLTSDADAMTEAIRTLHEREPIDGVVAQLEPAIESTAIACERLSIPFTCSKGILAARNKARTRDLLEAAGLASARHRVVHDVDAALRTAEEFGYPVVAKPTSGMDSMLAFRADAAATLREAAERILAAPGHVPAQITAQMSRGILIEEHLPGELVSAELALLDGECYPFIVCGRSRGLGNDCVEMGASLPAGVGEDDVRRCFSYARAACEAVGLDFGVFHVELMVSPAGPVLVELNPRPMGGIMTEMYTRLTGREFSDYILDVYLRRPPRDVVTSIGPKTITARKIIARQACTLADEIDLSWVEGLDSRFIVLHPYCLTPGARVERDQVLARYVVMDETWTKTMGHANGLLERFERSIGIPIYHSMPLQV